ncbi:hypothetical protein HanPI659440_Chr02g0037611 [Helianthus annuus]|nr:hypothetical protein HanPI659440_Chr02g0037611 [Helianthus annuus]
MWCSTFFLSIFPFDRPIATRLFFPVWQVRRNARVLDHLSYFLCFTFRSNFFTLARRNRRTWFKDFTLFFVRCYFFSF